MAIRQPTLARELSASLVRVAGRMRPRNACQEMPQAVNGTSAFEPLKRESYLALHQQIAGGLVAEIRAGKYGLFARIPSERELMARFGVSRVTVRNALAALHALGLLVTSEGNGTFVAGPAASHSLEDLTGFYDALVAHGLTPEMELLQFRIAKPPPTVAQKLQSESQKAAFFKRLYRINGRPLALMTAYLPTGVATSREAAVNHVIYELLTRLGIRIARADLGIRTGSAADDFTAALELPPHTPLLSWSASPPRTDRLSSSVPSTSSLKATNSN